MQNTTVSSDSVSWHSSYEENNYGDLFYSLIRLYQPERIVELGTKAGYSAFHMARALTANGHGTLDCYDLWEKYTQSYGFDTVPKSVAEKNLQSYMHLITLHQTNAFAVSAKYQTVDILHIDLDNTGEVLEKTIPSWLPKVNQLIIIEGGSVARDNLDEVSSAKKMPVADWLAELGADKADALKQSVSQDPDQFVVVGGAHQAKPMTPWLAEFGQQHNLEIFTFPPFPSLTLLRKK